MAETLRYRAFLSYSHADTGVAKRVHGRLEGFRIDKDLVGRETPSGQIPETLRPIFRDRLEFDAGSSLADETIAALDGSAALIVLASPHAACSKFVNEELRQFKLRHPDRPLIPLIVDGDSGDPEKECFPPALRFAITEHGAITDIRYARKHGTQKRPWLGRLMERRPTKVAAVALANKIARMAWAIMVRGERYKEPKLLLAA